MAKPDVPDRRDFGGHNKHRTKLRWHLGPGDHFILRHLKSVQHLLEELRSCIWPVSLRSDNLVPNFSALWKTNGPFRPGALATPSLFPADNVSTQEHGAPQEQFFSDAAAGKLPQYSFIDINGTFQSQEAPQNMVDGEGLMAAFVNAVGSSPQWSKSLIIINYDEHGGYYDHVPVPVALAPDFIAPIPPAGDLQYDGFKRYSFRVPAVVISPWSKKDHVVHKVHDHTSVLALLQRKWNLPAKTFRDANANDMTDFIDMDALQRGRMNFPSIKALRLSPPGNTTEGRACSSQTNNVQPPADAFTQPLFTFPT
jgi:phospholipase C